MHSRDISDEEFIHAWADCGGTPQGVADRLQLPVRSVYRRRKMLSDRGVDLTSNPRSGREATPRWRDMPKGRACKAQVDLKIDTGVAIVFNDARWWPDQPKTVAHEALLLLTKELKPRAMLANGDLLDGARISRHAPHGWAELPTVKEELEVCQDYMYEIERLLPRGCHKAWHMGNHCNRFDKALVAAAPEFGGVVERLEDHFSRWAFSWSSCINDDVMVKHRHHNGVHAAYNNTLKGGRTIVTGHLHRLLVTPWSDYNRIRWGVDAGTLAEPDAPQFEYAENNPSPHTSGFAVLTFKDGRLLPPELVSVVDNKAWFRSQCVFDGDKA